MICFLVVVFFSMFKEWVFQLKCSYFIAYRVDFLCKCTKSPSMYYKDWACTYLYRKLNIKILVSVFIAFRFFSSVVVGDAVFVDLSANASIRKLKFFFFSKPDS